MKYRAQAAKICKLAEKQVNAVPNPPAPGHPEVALAVFTALARIDGAEVAKLERLRPPSSLSQRVRQGLSAKRRLIALINRVVPKALTEIKAGTFQVDEIFPLAVAAQTVKTKWSSVGVVVCQY